MGLIFRSCKEGRHRYEARYDRSLLPGTTFDSAPASAIEALKNSIYIRDVCVRCGNTIERIKEQSHGS